jgi:hypothetical protein
MNWLVLIIAFQVGSSAQQTVIGNNSTQIIWLSPENAFYTQMEMGAEILNHINIEGIVKSYQVYDKEISFNPYQIDYGFNAFAELKGFKLGFYHQCNHPVVSNFVNKDKIFGENKTEIYLRYELKINPF